MVNQKKITPLFQSLTRPILMMGGERENIIICACISLMLAFSGRDFFAVGLAVIIWLVGLIASKIVARIANSAESGLLRLEQLIMEAGVVAVPKAIVEAVNFIIFIQKKKDAKKGRQVTSILRLKGYSERGYQYE